MLSRIRAFLARRRRRPSGPPVIEADEGGFVLRFEDGATVDVRWPSVRRIAAYKRDLYTTDVIMLALELDAPAPSLIELSEEWRGFAELFGGMERALGVSPEWYVQIMVPAFEPMLRILYERPVVAS